MYFILALVHVIVKNNRAMAEHCIYVIYLYQFVIASSEIQNFI